MAGRKGEGKANSSHVPKKCKRMIERLRKCSDTVFLNEIKVISKPPKKAKSPQYHYLQHCLDEGTIDKDMDKRKRFYLARQLYYKLPDKEKFEFIKKSYYQDSEYLEKVARYNTLHPEAKLSEQSILSRGQLKIYEEISGVPPRPYTTPYAIFSQQTLRSLKEIDSAAERMFKLSEIWKNVPADVKARFDFEHKLCNYRYFISLEEYFSTLTPKEKEWAIMRTKVKYPFENRLQFLEVAYDANEEAKLMKYDDLIKINQLEEIAIALYAHEGLLKILEMNPTYENPDHLEVSREEWPSLGRNVKERYLKRAYPVHYLRVCSRKTEYGKLDKYLPRKPITGSRHSDLESLGSILLRLPKRKTLNGYAIFSKKMWLRLKTENNNKKMTEVAKMWKELDEESKKRYNMEAKIMKARLQTEEEEFEDSLKESELQLLKEYRKNVKKHKLLNKIKKAKRTELLNVDVAEASSSGSSNEMHDSEQMNFHDSSDGSIEEINLDDDETEVEDD